MEDYCAGCIGKNGIDIWMNSNNGCFQELINCQNAMTNSNIQVENNPPSNRPVKSHYIFDTDTCNCIGP